MISLRASLIFVGFLVFGGCEKPAPAAADADDEGRRLVVDSIAAHGGKERWYGNGLLKFRWTYHLADRGPEAVTDTIQTVDPETMAVVHEVPGSEIRFGMNGGQAWIMPPGAEFNPPPRFWALTPFYFFGIPFVFNDPNARFEMLAEPVEFEGKAYDQVKITYTAEAGDTPDDYYVLLIDPGTKLTRGAYYIVTSPQVAPDGPGPPKLITLDGLREIDGVKLASGHRTFEMNDGRIGGRMRFTVISEVGFLPRGSVDLGIPEGAEMR